MVAMLSGFKDAGMKKVSGLEAPIPGIFLHAVRVSAHFYPAIFWGRGVVFDIGGVGFFGHLWRLVFSGGFEAVFHLRSRCW